MRKLFVALLLISAMPAHAEDSAALAARAPAAFRRVSHQATPITDAFYDAYCVLDFL